MKDPSAPPDHSGMRNRWYSEGWYSSQTCIDVLVHAATEHARVSSVFATTEGETVVTVADVHTAAKACAAGMQARGIESGDAVAVQLTNRVECAVVYQATLLCGAVLVPVVHVYGPAEMTFILAESRAKMLVMPARIGSNSYIGRIADYASIPSLQTVVVVDADESSSDYLPWTELAALPEQYVVPDVASDDVCAILYTSGTVSAPKGVQHSHNSLLAEQATLPTLIAGRPDDIQLVTFPPGHIAGLNSMLRPYMSGTRSVFLDQWNPRRAADLIMRFGVTATSGAPFHLQSLLEVDGVSAKLKTLREFLTGAATVTEDLGRRAEAAGVTAYRCYGMTEQPTVTGAHADESARDRMATDGLPMGGCAVRILDEQGIDQLPGVDGQVVVQGPDQFVGYQNAQLNAGAFTSDGWFCTGDLGHLDRRGRLTITDRIKDVIIRGGETISSSQIEDVLHAHPAVAEATAVAAPDDRYGEVVAAVVVLSGGASFDLAEVRRHFAESGLARQKTPERLAIVESLPRTALGKVRKADLRKLFVKGVEISDA